MQGPSTICFYVIVWYLDIAKPRGAEKWSTIGY